MCLAIPMQVVKIDKEMAEVKAGGLRRRINIQMVLPVKVGDYVLVHAGFAIQKVDPKQARQTLRFWDEIS